MEVESQVDIEYLVKTMPRAIAASIDGMSRIATIVRSMKAFAHTDQAKNTLRRSTLSLTRPTPSQTCQGHRKDYYPHSGSERAGQNCRGEDRHRNSSGGARYKGFDPLFATKEVTCGTGQDLAIAHPVIATKYSNNITLRDRTRQRDHLLHPQPNRGSSAASKHCGGRIRRVQWPLSVERMCVVMPQAKENSLPRLKMGVRRSAWRR